METKLAVETYPMIIGDKQVPGTSGKFIEVINPSTEEVVGMVPVASPEEIDLAVKTAQAAFKTWRETPAAERAAMMMKLVQAVRGNIDEIARILTKEQGKPFWAAKGEINGFCAVIDFYAQAPSLPRTPPAHVPLVQSRPPPAPMPLNSSISQQSAGQRAKYLC